MASRVAHVLKALGDLARRDSRLFHALLRAADPILDRPQSLVDQSEGPIVGPLEPGLRLPDGVAPRGAGGQPEEAERQHEDCRDSPE